MKVSLKVNGIKRDCTHELDGEILKVHVSDLDPNPSLEVIIDFETYGERIPEKVYVCIDKCYKTIEVNKTLIFKN